MASVWEKFGSPGESWEPSGSRPPSRPPFRARVARLDRDVTGGARSEQRVYTALYQQVERFRKKRGSMAMRDLEAAQKSYEEVYDEIIDRIPLKIRVRGLTPEQRLEGLTPEQWVKGLTPEQRVQFAKLLASDPTPSARPAARRDQVKKKRRQ